MEYLMIIALILFIVWTLQYIKEIYDIYKDKPNILNENHLYEHILILSIAVLNKIVIIWYLFIKFPISRMTESQVYIPLLLVWFCSSLILYHLKKERIQGF